MSHGFSSKNTADLVAALSVALDGTHGRDVNPDALRSLVSLEIGEWRASNPNVIGSAEQPLVLGLQDVAGARQSASGR